ncbi:MAG: tetratricopeptide repeat protein [Verrucomicrobia bacterium]|nr:MAG: tetratricopeptide repeat protein [Verrucomicrobiota bacterium]
MKKLGPPDSHHLDAAIGWLGLGAEADAIEELDRISKSKQNHPDVLDLRWTICAQHEDWAQALLIAQTLVQLAPRRASSWLHYAYALRRVPEGGLEKARAILQPAAEKFPEEPIIPFNLACYACQMRKPEAALEWLRRALDLGGKSRIKAMALQDGDLKPLWPEIEKL